MMRAGAISYPLVEGFRSRAVSTEGQRLEQALASVRLVLAIGFAIYLTRGASLPHTLPVYRAVLAYIAYSVILLVLTRTKQEVGPALRLSAHAVDTLWAVFIFWSAASPVNGLSQEEVFFIFVIFVLLAAAYRWGLRGTLATSGAWIMFL